MPVLDDDMKRVVSEQQLGFVATVNADGTPNLSPKGTLSVWDDEQLMFVDIRSPQTAANLERNAAVEVNVVDPLLRKGYRFRGVAEVHRDRPIFERVVAERSSRGNPLVVQSVVLIRVEVAVPVTSPAYDLGEGEPSIRARWLTYWTRLWSRM
ncbi:MAG: pyridoxamine 5'-phosphate oxidase family protein [Dehalococcoidia bacterium]|nr:pyridoxamine 5'-phosphate oxidase family protein [Dehalococcoidia bacterium]MCB9484803.1 pyridoxamine 5'-phosphate oxidase family protein [Thermoflexaceae bacterium]